MPLHKVLLGCSLASLVVPQGWRRWWSNLLHPRWVLTRASRLSEALWAIWTGSSTSSVSTTNLMSMGRRLICYPGSGPRTKYQGHF